LTLISVVFFFFQAEDGIRDLYVTGVQTCALPILEFHRKDRAAVDGAGGAPPVPGVVILRGVDGDAALGLKPAPSEHVMLPAPPRSEERRVGKECRSRWWPE